MIITGKVSIRSVAWDQRRQLATILLVALSVYGLHYVLGERWVFIEVLPLTALGVVLGVSLSLRNNMVYDRYWEGRTLWGALINTSRTFARQLGTYLTGGTAEERERVFRELCLRHVAFVRAFRAHLRDEDTRADAAPYLSPEEASALEDAVNVPSALLHQTGELLREAWRRGLVTEWHLTQIDGTLTDITNILGGCERIKNTPLPPAYTYLAHKIMLSYCCLVPLGLVKPLGLAMIPLSLVITFAFLTLDRTSDLIEQPFATEDNDLPLNALARNIEREMLQRVGEKNLPPPVEPVEGVLL